MHLKYEIHSTKHYEYDVIEEYLWQPEQENSLFCFVWLTDMKYGRKTFFPFFNLELYNRTRIVTARMLCWLKEDLLLRMREIPFLQSSTNDMPAGKTKII